MSRRKHRKPGIARLSPLAGLLAMGLLTPALADKPNANHFPTYETGPQKDGSWVVSTGQIINPAGIQVDLGIRVRAKAIALNPTPGSHTAAVLTLGASRAVIIFDTLTGKVVQEYAPFEPRWNAPDSQGSYSGIAYSADGKYILFSQDSSVVSMAKVQADGKLADYARVDMPIDNSFIKCFPNSPIGAYERPCGTFYSTWTSYPGGLAQTTDGKSAYVLLNQNNTLAKIDTSGAPKYISQIRVGNAPHSILINGTTAYVSNEGGREAKESDSQIYSAGTPLVSDKVNGSTTTGTVSVVDLPTMKVVQTIQDGIGLHPTGMAVYGNSLLVSNTYSDTISVIDMATKKVIRTIRVATPIGIPGQPGKAYGAAPTEIAVNADAKVAYVALYNANAVAVVDLNPKAERSVLGMIPVAFAPGSVKFDKANNQIVVANDKGIGTRFPVVTSYGVKGLNSRQDNGTVSIVKIPDDAMLKTMSKQVYKYNHWDLEENIESASGGSPKEDPVPLPEKIGSPSLIKHVFLIIRENRTYDQIHGDDPRGDGDPSLAVFGRTVTPNMHKVSERFPLLDNFYDPSRQSADGHQWIVEAIAPYADDIQSPDWVRSYPGGNAGDGMAYHQKGFLFQEADEKGLRVKIYGEYAENEYFKTPLGHPTWSDYYNDALLFETGAQPKLKYEKAAEVASANPIVSKLLVKNFPMYDLAIPDQWRVDWWKQDFEKDLKAGSVPALTIIWITNDHTGGPPSARAQVADNDLAVGRMIDIISHSKVWDKSAIFIEEDDPQNGVDHVDGHRSPGYVVSPYAVQGAAKADHTYYTQINMTRTIEQILGLPPMNHYDLTASPMRTTFVKDKPPQANFKPFDHVPNQIPLDEGVVTPVLLAKAASAAGTPAAAQVDAQVLQLQAAWAEMKKEMFKGKANKPDSVDADTLNHLTWYETTNFTRPYPGENQVRWPEYFKERKGLETPEDEDGDGDGL
jgi:YVTN family beta-propeller protein